MEYISINNLLLRFFLSSLSVFKLAFFCDWLWFYNTQAIERAYCVDNYLKTRLFLGHFASMSVPFPLVSHTHMSCCLSFWFGKIGPLNFQSDKNEFDSIYQCDSMLTE